MNIDALIHAYEEELKAYRRRGLPDRAKLVEEELRRLGHSPGVTPSDDVLAKPTSTSQPEDTQTLPEAPKEPKAPTRPTTRKKR
jgi:hypothetical protein